MTEHNRSYPKKADMVSVWVAQEQNATVHYDCAKPRGIEIALELLQPYGYECYICGKKIGATTGRGD